MPTSATDTMRDARSKIRDGMVLIIRRQLRNMRRNSARPRATRLPKEARMLKSLLAEASAAGLVPPAATEPRRAKTRAALKQPRSLARRRGRASASARKGRMRAPAE